MLLRATDESLRWFPSKIDWWLRLLLISLPLISIGSSAVALLESGLKEAAITFVLSMVPIAAVFIGLVWPTRYAISEDSLVLRFGLLRQKIPLAKITHVRPSRLPLSSPALSLNRLLVRHGKGPLSFVLISPDDRDVFLDLLSRSTGLPRRGETLGA